MRNTSHISVPGDAALFDEELRHMNAANWQQPPLEVAPCVKLKSSGEIHVWSQFFAERPELCDCCDEYGNTDPAAWRGRRPHTSNLTGKLPLPPTPPPPPEPTPEPQPAAAHPRAPHTPNGMLFQFNYDLYDRGDASKLDSVHMSLGVPEGFTQSYQVHRSINNGLHIPTELAGKPVNNIIDGVFAGHI